MNRPLTGALAAFAGLLAAVFGARAYQHPFGATAPWNIPVAAGSAALVDRLWGAGRPRERVGARNLNVTTYGYSFLVYHVAGANGSYLVRTRYGWGSNIEGGCISCNPRWAPSHGLDWPRGSDYDSQMTVLDPSTGREWDLWQYAYDPASRVEPPPSTGSDANRP